MVVDSEKTNYKDFIQSVVDKYPPGYLEVSHVQYYDDVLRTFPEVKSNQDLLTMFDMHHKKKDVVLFIVYCDPSESFQPISEWDFEGEEQPEKNIELDGDNYLSNPKPLHEHDLLDEENMYPQSAPMSAPVNKVVQEEHDLDDDSKFGSDVDSALEDDSEDEEEVEEEDEYEEKSHHQIIGYDEDDPPMKVGSTYPTMAEFKLALCQHAIKHEFEFRTKYSSKHRFRAYCSRKMEDNCPWKIHASTTVDKVTVMVSVC